MSVRVFPKIYSQVSCPTDVDEIIGALALPGDSRLNGLSGRCQVIAETRTSVLTIASYGLHAYVVPMLDPDGTHTPQSIWDAQVPKDKNISSGVLDLDTENADTTSAFEMGQVDAEKVIGLSTAPIQVFDRTRLLSFASPGAKAFDTADETYIATDQFRLGLKHPVEVDLPSILLFGFSSPDTLQSTTTFFIPQSDQEWAQLTYLQDTLRDAFKELVGLVEAGAETPYEDAASIIASLLERLVEESAGAFLPVTWRVFSEFSFDLTLRGDMDVSVLTGQR